MRKMNFAASARPVSAENYHRICISIVEYTELGMRYIWRLNTLLYALKFNERVNV